jgi:hypothetical protein
MAFGFLFTGLGLGTFPFSTSSKAVAYHFQVIGCHDFSDGSTGLPYVCTARLGTL